MTSPGNLTSSPLNFLYNNNKGTEKHRVTENIQRYNISVGDHTTRIQTGTNDLDYKTGIN